MVQLILLTVTIEQMRGEIYEHTKQAKKAIIHSIRHNLNWKYFASCTLLSNRRRVTQTSCDASSYRLTNSEANIKHCADCFFDINTCLDHFACTGTCENS